jgi:hypothetical protein
MQYGMPHIPVIAAPSEEKALADLLREKGLEPKEPVHSQTTTIEITNPEHEAYIKKKYGKQLEAGEPITIDEEDNKLLGVWE